MAPVNADNMQNSLDYITGSIPGDMAKIPSLNYLNLAWNQLYGTLGSFADGLPKLPAVDAASLPDVGPDNR